MRAAVAVPVTVKTRLGVDDHDSYEFARDFIARGRGGRLRHVHRARAQGVAQRLEPEAESRDSAARLRARASAEARVSGAAHRHQRRARRRSSDSVAQLEHVDGVMIGRAAYQDSWLLARLDAQLFGRLAGDRARGARCVRALRRARARAWHAAARHDAALARHAQRPSGRPALAQALGELD